MTLQCPVCRQPGAELEEDDRGPLYRHPGGVRTNNFGVTFAAAGRDYPCRPAAVDMTPGMAAIVEQVHVSKESAWVS